MPIIQFQPDPKIPPIGFFDPISADPKDMMTDVEYLLGILKKLNEVIAQTNANTKFIEEYSGKIEEIEAEVAALRDEMTDFELDINNQINLRFANIKVELQAMIATALIQANAYTDATAARLEQEIQDISLGEISVFDPTTGIYSPLQTVIDNLYNSSREDSLTASEYDALELTASTYDGFLLTAREYDQNSKSIILGLLSA